MKRRSFLEYTIGAAAGSALLRAGAFPMSGAALHADVKKYWEFGGHRTGTSADEKTTDWLLAELETAGFETTRQTFRLRQFFSEACQITQEGRKVAIEALWPVAGEADVSAVIGETGIAVARLPAESGGAMSKTNPGLEIIHRAVGAGAKAVVLVTEGPTGEIIQQNDESDTRRWPVPVTLLAPKDAAALTAGKPARLQIRGKIVEQAIASNAQGSLQRGKNLIVVSTPKSGWFRCAGERGPGIALWLGMARSLAKQQGGPSFLFTANSGHELHGIGMKEFLKTGAPKPAEVACWLHFGAGIATYAVGADGRLSKAADTKRYLTCTTDVAAVIAPAFAGMPELKPITDYQLGELRYLVAAGYRGFSIAAGHRLHHTPIDDPLATGGDILEPIGKAFQRALGLIQTQWT